MVQGIPRQGGRRRRQPASPQLVGQPTPAPTISTNSTKNFYEKFFLGAKIVGVLFLFWIVLNVVSCTATIFNWGRDKAKEMTEKTEKLSDDFDKKIAGITSNRKVRKKEAATKKVEVEKRKKVDEAVHLSVRRLLSRSYAQARGWKNLNLELRDVSDTERSLTFPIISFEGTHLPPLDLALTPEGTTLVLQHEDPFAGLGNNLWVTYAGSKHRLTSRSRLPADVNCILTPLILWDWNSKLPDIKEWPSSKCKMTLQYSSVDKASEDRNTRIVLEKVFWSDFDQPVKVMDLPTVVDGVPVYWDLVVRCYPAWIPNPDTGMGRWMPSPALDSEYLDLLPPSLHIKQTEDPAEPVIWSDEEGLLSNGSFKTSSEEMIERVHAWRLRHGYSDVDWKGGDQLHIMVKKFPDRTASEERPIGVTIRVILRVRTWKRG